MTCLEREREFLEKVFIKAHATMPSWVEAIVVVPHTQCQWVLSGSARTRYTPRGLGLPHIHAELQQ